MKTLFKNIFSILLLLSTAILFTSCDNPTSSDEEEHSEPFGVALILNGVEIAALENGVLTYAEGDHIELKVGEETDLITVRWISEDGDRFVPDENDGYSLRWMDVNENVLEIEQHEEDGAWRFHFVGLSAGESDVRLQLFHNGHSDFTSTQPFEIHVEQAVSGMEVRDDSGTPLLSVSESNEITGSLSVNVNETTGELSALFLDDEGNEIELDDEYEMKWHIESGSEFLTVDRSTSNPFTFTLTGTAAGQATMHFELIKEHGDHGDEGDDHSDDEHSGIVVYASPDITITVN